MITLPFHAPEGYRPAFSTDALEGYWFVYREDKLLIRGGARPDDASHGDVPAVPYGAPPALAPASRTIYLGRLGEHHCFALEADAGSEAPTGMDWTGLRGLFTRIDDALFSLAGRALHLVEWDRTHRYCGRCGTPTEAKADERARVCPSCGQLAYPRVSPAVMMLIRRGRELLLARSPRFPNGTFSALAGFVEPGESLEQCVAREVDEEVGLRVKNIRYFASQPWPFPHSLMVAFHCEYAGGDIRLQPEEIAEAHWFDVFQLPALPGNISISKALINAAAAEIRGEIEAN
jgi:NAD+ diphosphatase